MINLDSEEQEILEAFESDRMTQTANWQEKLEQHREIASATFAQKSTINTLFLRKTCDRSKNAH